MASVDINFGMAVIQAFDSAAISTDTTTVGLDIDMNDGTNDFEALEIILNCSAFTDGSYTIDLKESDDDSTYTAVAAADILGTNTAIVAINTPSHIGYVGKKRYVRVSVVSTGTTTGATLAAVAIQGEARQTPLS